ncbi:MAG: nitroreductase [Coriobacteriales bacterium]|nr:nitroreductase [Coriobacteriales bacterium]
MNETIKVMHERRSIRSFTDEEVPRDIIEQIVEAGLWAASGMGRQAPIIVAITNRELRDKLCAMNAAIMGKEGFDTFYGGQVVLVVLADKSVPTYVYDGSLVMGNLMHAASSLGVGSIWIHRAKEEFESAEGKAILAELGIEGDYEGIGHCVLGYAASEPKAAERKEGRVFWAS